MKIERDERRLDFHGLGLAIKKAREASGMTQEQLAYVVDRTPHTIMYNVIASRTGAVSRLSLSSQPTTSRLHQSIITIRYICLRPIFI